jgi:hypothetical protein
VTDPTINPDYYSKAFERFVEDEDDLVGLLGYALYKAHIREAARSGRLIAAGGARDPTTQEVAAFKGEAKSRLGDFGNSIVEQAKPELVRTEFGNELDAAKAEILAGVERRTGFWPAVSASVIAWLISIAITVLVVLNGIPDWLVRLRTR